MSMLRREQIIATTECTTCGAKAGEKCRNARQQRKAVHKQRADAAYKAAGLGQKKKRGKASPKRKKASSGFYSSWEWQQVRYEAFRIHGRQCMCCGFTPYPGCKQYLCVDHIKPRSKFPKLALNVANTQILCNSCNRGKSNIYQDDWRKEWHGEEAEEENDPLTAQFKAIMQ